MLKPLKLQNVSSWDKEQPTIVIDNSSSEWDEAYANWLAGKPPTKSPEWKKGIVLGFEESK